MWYPICRKPAPGKQAGNLGNHREGASMGVRCEGTSPNQLKLCGRFTTPVVMAYPGLRGGKDEREAGCRRRASAGARAWVMWKGEKQKEEEKRKKILSLRGSTGDMEVNKFSAARCSASQWKLNGGRHASHSQPEAGAKGCCFPPSIWQETAFRGTCLL